MKAIEIAARLLKFFDPFLRLVEVNWLATWSLMIEG